MASLARARASVSRRSFLLVLGGGAASLLAACQAAAPVAPTAAPAAKPTTAPAAAPTTAPAAAKPAEAAKPAAPGATTAPAAQAAGGAAGSAKNWDEVLAAAKKEGVVSVYGPPGTSYRTALIEGFQRAQPSIKVDYSGADGSQQAAKLVAERQGGKFLADIYVGGTGSVLRSLTPTNALDPLEDAFILPEVRDKSLWFQNSYMFVDKAGKYFMAFGGDVSGVSVFYNTQQVKPADVRKWTDLLDPKWKGKIVSGDPNTNGVTRGNLASVAAVHGMDFIRKLYGKEVGITLTGDNRQLTDWIVQGRFPIGIGVTDLPDAKSIGLPIDENPLDDVAVISGGFGNVGLVNKAPHPNAAMVFINWLLGKDGQLAWQKNVEAPSLRMDVPRDGLPAGSIPDPNKKYVNTQHEDFVPIRDELQKAIQEVMAAR